MSLCLFFRNIYQRLRKMDESNRIQKAEEEQVFPDQLFYSSFNLPKIENKGEDADPLCIIKEKSAVLAVFDGLGGAGSKIYKTANEQEGRTGAAIASKMIRDLLAATLEGNEEVNAQGGLNVLLKDSSLLKRLIKKTLVEEKKKRESHHAVSKLKSSLMQSFPTTIAMQLLIDQGETVECHSFWAGDSRNYCLESQKGLRQLTHDHLAVKGDAFENLHNDSRMSNFISADSEFDIEILSYSFEKPVIFISASDGCYDYLQTPMHFEILLLEEMKNAESFDDWCTHIKTRLQNIPAGDDCSMSLLSFGWSDFSQLKESFVTRTLELSEKVKVINELSKKLQKGNTELENLRNEIAETEKQFTLAKEKGWEDYKHNYYTTITNPK